jgi:hypothetical protein
MTMMMAAQSLARIDEPLGAEYNTLMPVPGSPKIQLSFGPTPATTDTSESDSMGPRDKNCWNPAHRPRARTVGKLDICGPNAVGNWRSRTMPS